MKINCYGDEVIENLIVPPMAKERLETKRSGAWTFARYTEGEKVVVHRFGIRSDGAVEETWSFGKWSDAETLVYISLDETLEVEA